MLDQRPARLTPGELLANRYRLQDAVERAGFGHAWRACDESNGRSVEVHDLATPRGTVGLGEAVECLKAHAAVKHRALATTHDAFVHAGGVVVVTALGEGAPLDAWFEERSRSGAGARLEAVRTVLDQVAQGLWALHRSGDPPLAHGAFGGPCVRVEVRGSQAVVRVEAHGWARVVAPPGWWVCPPEGEAQTPAADVFALGLLATTLLTGRSSAMTPDAVRRRFTTHAPEVDASVIDVIAACLTEDPTLRLPDARSLRDRFMHASVSWKPRERAIVAPAPRPRRVVDGDETPVIVAAPPRGPQVWLVPAKPPAAPAPSLPEEAEEQTHIEPPSVSFPRPIAPKPSPPVEDDGETTVDAPAPPVVEEEGTWGEPPAPPPRVVVDVVPEEVTDVAAGDAFRSAEGARPPAATPRSDLSDVTRTRSAPDDEPTDVASGVGDESTSPIGALPGAFGARSQAREQTLVPQRTTADPPSVIPEERTAPMDDPPRTALAGGPSVSAPWAPPVAAPPSHAPAAPAVVPAPVLVVGVVVVGMLLGLVLWWAIR